jgi:hypothetical protein
MMDPKDLVGLVRAYCGGDLLARKAILDWLEEEGDPRADLVRAEEVDWNALARRLDRQMNGDPHGVANVARLRFWIDCARYGSSTVPEVTEAVTEARRQWLQGLFPEFDLSPPSGGG